MAEEAPETPPTPTPPTPPTPWYEGKADAEIIGHWQNKGWKTDDPATIAIEATKAAREAQRFVGAPPEQLLRMPKDETDEAARKTVLQRLGLPEDPSKYDFSSVEFSDGSEIGQDFTDAMRSTIELMASRPPSQWPGTLMSSVVKFMENAEKQEQVIQQGKIAEEKETLAKSWGTNSQLNHLKAMEGAKRLGVTPEEVGALESVVGYARIMEMFRKVGAGTTEDSFIEGGSGGQGQVATREAALARRAELENDAAWRKRWLEGGAAEAQEMNSLNAMISGFNERAA